MGSKPKVSVIMAVYNSSKYIKPAIESVLDQTLQDFELIIVNDGSTDNSIEIINSYKDDRIKILSQNNSGAASARNNGINQSQSNYIAIQDSDDISYKYRLEKQYDYLDNNKEYILVGGNADIIDCNGIYIYSSNVVLSNREIKNNIKNMPLFHPSILFIKKYILEVGGYPEYLRSDEDIVLINKLKNKGKMANLPSKIIQYRVTPASLTQRNNFIDGKLNEIIDKAIKYDSIDDDEISYIKNRIKKLPLNIRKINYHIFLMKKFLFNNYNFTKAINNYKKAIYLNPLMISTYLYLPLVFLPRKFITVLHNTVKKLQGERF